MSTDAEELAKTIGGMNLRRIIVVLIACCSTIAAIGAAVAGWRQVGGPVPATRSYVDARDQRLSAEIAELASFARESRIMNLNEKWWRLDAEIEDIQEKLTDHPGNAVFRNQERMLRRDRQSTRDQIERLEQR